MKKFQQTVVGRLGSLNTSVSGKKLPREIAQLKKYYASVLFPEDNVVGLDELIGMENEKETLQDALNFLNNIEEYQKNPLLSPHTRYLLAGAPGSGKSALVNALAKSANVPLITISLTAVAAFPKKVKSILDLVFKIAHTMPDGCIILFNDYPAIRGLSDEMKMFFHNHFVSHVISTPNAIIFLSTAEGIFEIPAFYFEQNAFSQNKTIMMQPPTLKTRELLIKDYLKKFGVKVAKDVSTEQLARNTLGMYPKDLEYIVRETKLHVMRNNRSVVTSKDFNDVMLTMEAGQMYNKLTDKERVSTAYHEAGHVIAAYYSNPDYVLGRVEITPRAASLGLTQGDAGEEKHCLFKKEFEYEIIYCYGGMAAEKLIYKDTTSGVSADIASATAIALLMYQNLGMSEDLGPMVLDAEDGISSEKLWLQSETIIQNELKRLFDETYKIMQEHIVQLEYLTKALLKSEVLMGEEIKKVLDEATEKAKEYEGTPELLESFYSTMSYDHKTGKINLCAKSSK